VSKLSEEEKAVIAGRLNASKGRRRKISPGSVSVVVDGVEQSQFCLEASGRLQIELAAGAKLIEIRGEDAEGGLLLAAHVISYAGESFQFSKVTQSLNNGKLDLTVSPLPCSGEGARAVFTLTFKRRFELSWRAFAQTAWRLIRLTRPPEDTRCRTHHEVPCA
jgi:hypothetical protein